MKCIIFNYLSLSPSLARHSWLTWMNEWIQRWPQEACKIQLFCYQLATSFILISNEIFFAIKKSSLDHKWEFIATTGGGSRWWWHGCGIKCIEYGRRQRKRQVVAAIFYFPRTMYSFVIDVACCTLIIIIERRWKAKFNEELLNRLT